MIVLPDRCTITELKGRFLHGVKRNADDKDFLDFLPGDGIRINPLLFALEGNLRRNPTPYEIQRQLQEVSAALRIALPKAELVPGDSGGLRGVDGIVQDTETSMQKTDFLDAHGATAASGSDKRKQEAQLWDETLAVAKNAAWTQNLWWS